MHPGLRYALRRHRPTRIRDRAVALWTARNFDTKFDRLLDLSGNGLHARLGSAVGADSNDPLRLQFSGSKYIYAADTAQYITTGDSAATKPTTAIDFRVRLQVNDPSLLADQLIWVKNYASSAGSWYVTIYSGNINFNWTDMAATSRAISAAIPAVAITTPTWFKITRLSSSGAWVISYSTEQVPTSNLVQTWTALGSGTQAAGTDIGTTTSGTYAARNVPGTGFRIYAAELRKEIDGAITAGFCVNDFAEPYATHVSATGETWNFVRATSGRKLAVVDRDLLLLGTDDYLEVANHPLLNFGAGQAFSVAWIGRTYGLLSGQARVAKKTGLATSGTGYALRAGVGVPTDSYFDAYDGASNLLPALASLPTSGVASLLAGVSVSGVQTRHHVNSASDVRAGSASSVSNSEALRIGRLSGAGTGYGDFEFIAAAIFREALSAADLQRLRGELLT
jgi:hypothetical protein